MSAPIQRYSTAIRQLPRRARDRWTEFRGYTPIDRDLFYLCIEIVPAGLALGMTSFNTPFLIKLGASSDLIGWYLALPALVAILLTMPFARLLERQPTRKPWLVAALAIVRLATLGVGLAPWLLPREWLPQSIVAIVVVQAIPAALFNAGFLAVLGDVVPPNRSSTFHSARAFFLAMTVAVSSFLSGFWLEWAPFPFNYQVLNIAGFLLAQYSTYLVSRANFPIYSVKPPAASPSTLTPGPRRIGLDLSGMKKFIAENRSWVNLNLNVLVGWIGIWGALPLLSVYFVKELKLGERWLGLNGMLAQLGVLIGATIWNKVIQRRGNQWVIHRALSVYWLYPVLLVLAPVPVLLLAFTFGFTSLDPAISVTLFSMLVEFSPPERRSSFMASHVSLMNVGAMLAPLLMTQSLQFIDVRTALLVCAAFRLTGLLLMQFLPFKSTPVKKD